MMKEFKDFRLLFSEPYVKFPKKIVKKLEDDALDWLLNDSDTRQKIKHYYQGGLLLLNVSGLGDYYYAFIIEMMHFEYWQLKEWKSGFEHGVKAMKLPEYDHTYTADDNPHLPTNFYSYQAWHAGFVQGLHNFKFHKL